MWLLFFAGVLAVASSNGKGWLESFANALMTDANVTAVHTSHGLIDHVRERAVAVSAWCVPVLLGAVAVAVLSRLAQVGFLWVPNRVAPNPDRINPANRASVLLSPDSLVQFAKSLLVVGVALSLVGYGLWDGREQIAMASSAGLPFALTLLSQWGLRLGGVLLLFALIDYAYQRQRFEASLRMTPEEMRSEVKAVQGSGDVLAERRRRARA